MMDVEARYMVFKDSDDKPIGLPNEVNSEVDCDAALENVPLGCCIHSVYTKEWLISHEYFVEEDFYIRGD